MTSKLNTADQTLVRTRPTPPEIYDLLYAFKTDLMFNFNCHAIGRIEAFDATKQTAKISIAYQKQVGEVVRNYSPLVDCPVVVMSGGNAGITFPISVGDTCLVLFNDRDIDSWYSSGQVVLPNSSRMHSLADGIALVGIRHMGNVISNYEAEKAKFYKGTTAITLDEKVKIENATRTLLGVLNGLIDVIKGVQTIPAVVGSPLTLGPASISQLESYKTTLGELLK